MSDSYEQVKVPKSKKKQYFTEMKHDHNVWNQIFKEEQQKNLTRIS